MNAHPDHPDSPAPPWLGRTRSPEQTVALGAAVAQHARAGDLIALIGELGAGKTQFVRGLAMGMGLPPAALASPTFVMAQEYPTQRRESGGVVKGEKEKVKSEEGEAERGLTLVHIDAYRLKGQEDLESIGWGDIAQVAERRGTVVVVEWADRIADWLGDDFLEIHLNHEDPSTRGVTITARGSWAPRMAALVGILDRLQAPRIKCPTCGRPVAPEASTAPFCSERCKLIDLGKWLKGDYRLSRPVDQADLEE
jgi:tRNA threonylcarbamoyladenosine biosynthesis protein TsaE